MYGIMYLIYTGHMNAVQYHRVIKFTIPMHVTHTLLAVVIESSAYPCGTLD